MQLIDFCKMHGILIDAIPPIGVWRRYPTEDKPRGRNGAVCFMGDHAHIQNWATMTEAVTWRPEKNELPSYDLSALRERLKKADELKRSANQQAVRKAAWILGQCENREHPYLDKKGFKSMQGLVWAEKNILVIPMRIGQNLTSIQMINEHGEKRFLKDGVTDNATHVIDNKGRDYVCEGYATGLSIRRALAGFKMRYRVHVCFSAGNALKVAKTLPNCIFIADNDASGAGERAAIASGAPWWMPPVVGYDANDYELFVGKFEFGMALKMLALQK